MGYSDGFLQALFLESGLDFSDKKVKAKAFGKVSKLTGIPTQRVKYFNDKNILPSGSELISICAAFSINETYLQLKMGIIDCNLMEKLQNHSRAIYEIIDSDEDHKKPQKPIPRKVFETSLGELFHGDCLDLMSTVESGTVDLVFADPPFNLDKLYPSEMNDNLKEEEYIKWCESWLKECIRILKPGGALFTWNLPQWNSRFSAFLHQRLTFKHWVATDIKYSLPIKGRLYPSHYSLLYFVKGEKANCFNPDRLPAQVCPKCYSDIKDYGGYKHKMNPKGISLTDVWTDIPPVRHAKYKRREGSNELPIKLLDRVIELSTNEGDLVFDPFGGSGTTYVVAEIKNRRWLGCELDPCDIIKDRFSNLAEEEKFLLAIRENTNHLFTPKVKNQRNKLGLWTPETAQAKYMQRKKLKGVTAGSSQEQAQLKLHDADRQ